MTLTDTWSRQMIHSPNKCTLMTFHVFDVAIVKVLDPSRKTDPITEEG